LISIGTIGLIKGITTFDPDKGARLATYAARCVENATLSPATLRASSLHPKAAPDWRILDRISAEVAKLAGVTRAVYIDIACGITQHIPLEMVQ